MSDDELLQASCERLMGWEEALGWDIDAWRVPGTNKVFSVPMLSDEPFWLPRLRDECLRRGWDVAWMVDFESHERVTRVIVPGVPELNIGIYDHHGATAADMALAMLAAADAGQSNA